MKKFGIIAILLLAVTLGGLGAVHFVINQIADEGLTIRAVYGHPITLSLPGAP